MIHDAGCEPARSGGEAGTIHVFKARLETLLRSLPILPFGEAEARAAARIRADLETVGKPIGPHDVLIAATALAHGATLVTHNLREFRRVKGLLVEDWY